MFHNMCVWLVFLDRERGFTAIVWAITFSHLLWIEIWNCCYFEVSKLTDWHNTQSLAIISRRFSTDIARTHTTSPKNQTYSHTRALAHMHGHTHMHRAKCRRLRPNPIRKFVSFCFCCPCSWLSWHMNVWLWQLAQLTTMFSMFFFCFHSMRLFFKTWQFQCGGISILSSTSSSSFSRQFTWMSQLLVMLWNNSI